MRRTMKGGVIFINYIKIKETKSVSTCPLEKVQKFYSTKFNFYSQNKRRYKWMREMRN